MIRRFFCLLLVSLMLANQGLCFTHSHHWIEVADPESHASRPHFHFSDHGHHDAANDQEDHGDHSGHNPASDEHDRALPQAVAPVDDHDADAVYFGEAVTIAGFGNSVSVLSEKYSVAVLCVVEQSNGLLRLGLLRGHPPSAFEAACPIYLRTLSLRI